MLNNLTIKLKLIILLIGSVLGFLFMAVFMYNSVINSHHYGEIETKIEEMKSGMLMLRRNEKDFILRKDIKYKGKFEKNYALLVNNTNELITLLEEENISSAQAKKYIKILSEYKSSLSKYIDQQVTIGVNEKSGLYGSLRASVHKVQAYAKEKKNYELLAKVYDLRKQEKDFMLRRNLKYVDKYNKKIDKLLANAKLISLTLLTTKKTF